MALPHDVYDEKGATVALGVEIGRGGEGVIFALPQNVLECAKIYSKPLLHEDLRKLEIMVASAPDDPTWATQKHRSIAWPGALLYNDPRRSECVGFTMPKIDTKKFRKVLYYLDAKDRASLLGGGFNWKYLFTTAYNLTSAVSAVHARGHLIGDINESNVLVAANALISLIDCDSFQIRDPNTSEVFRCLVGKPEYTAPEIQGKLYRDVDRTACTDDFALAVLLFQLLMEGTHPYQAKGRLVDDAPSTQAKILKGHFPYAVSPGKNLAPPDYAPPYDILPPEIRESFRRCFVDGHKNPQARPSANDWFGILRGFGSRFQKCASNPNHFFLDHLTSCPWCHLAAKKGKDAFPSPVGQQVALADPTSTLDSVEKRLDYLRSHLMMALADGVLTPEEEGQLVALGDKLQLPRKTVERFILEEVKKAGGRAGGSPAGTPQLEVSKTNFEFHDLRAGETRQGGFIVSNVGGGALRGSITCNMPWLRVGRTQLDPTRHRQEVDFILDSSGLRLGSRSTGTIEVHSNGGNQPVTVNISLELPDEALKRFRRPVFWSCLGAGALFGYVFQSLLGVGSSWDAIGTIAGLLAIIMITVWGAKRAGWGGGLGGFFLFMILLDSLQRHSPAAFSAVSWAAVFSLLVSFSGSWLFARMQGRIMAASLFVIASGGVLALGVGVGGWMLGARGGDAVRSAVVSSHAAIGQAATPHVPPSPVATVSSQPPESTAISQAPSAQGSSQPGGNPGPVGVGLTPPMSPATIPQSENGTTPPVSQPPRETAPPFSYASSQRNPGVGGGVAGPAGTAAGASANSASGVGSTTAVPSSAPGGSVGGSGIVIPTAPSSGGTTSPRQLPAQPAIPSSGTVVWSGHLEKNGMITIDGESVSSGTLEGELPGVPVMIQVYPTNIGVADFPSPQNGWKKVVLRGSKGQDVVVRIEWKKLQQ